MADLFGLIRVRCHGHEAHRLYVPQRTHSLKHALQSVNRSPVLLGFTREIQLEKEIEGLSKLFEAVKHLLSINRMHIVKKPRYVLDLVHLQMADHVPAERVRKCLNFSSGFLNVILSEVSDACRGRATYSICVHL